MKLTVHRKISIGFVAALVAVLFIGWISFQSTNGYLSTYERVDHTHRVLETLAALTSDVTELESGRRSFIFTGDESYLTSYAAAKNDVGARISQLGDLVPDNPSQVQRIRQLQQLFEQQFSDDTSLIENRRNGSFAFGNRPPGSGAAAVRQLLLDMEGEEHRLLSSRSQISAAQAARAKYFILGGMLVAFLMGLASWILMERDLKLRTQVEAEKREAEARYRGIFENAFEGIYQSTPAGKFLDANPAMARMLGYSSSRELISSTQDIGYQIYASQADREELKGSLIREGGVNNLELQLRRKDGAPIWVSLNSRLVRDSAGKPAYFEGTLTDITERKNSAEESARLSKHNALLLESSGEGIYGSDVNGRCTFINSSALRMVGYRAEEMMGRAVHEMIHHSRSDGSPYPIEDCPIAQSAWTGRQCRVDNEIMWRKDGSYFPVEYLASPVVENGVIRGSVITFTDISDRRALEKELIEKNRELRAQNRRVEEANRLKSEFLANMSHELRTPLNGIIGFSELMVDEKVGSVSDVHKEFLNDILSSARHLLQLINDVLDLSKIEAGKMEFRPSSATMAKLVAEARDVLKSVAASKNIHVDIEITGIDTVFLDVGKFKQVLYNYLSNALKFTPESGTVVVRIEPDQPGFFLLEVEDSGIGIPAEDIPSLFVEFRQLDQGAAKKYSGTGLGLALTRRIVQAQGGKVGVRSTPGKGSTFWAVLPRQYAAIVKDEQILVIPQTVAVETTRARGKVLIVDDDPAALRIMETVLERLGYQPVCQPTVGGALRSAENERPQAVILDLVLPGLSGFDFLDRFRRSEAGANVPVVIWTAKELTGADHERLKYSVQAVVSKDSGGASSLLEALKPFLPGIDEGRTEGAR